ncbi:ThiF family adenylyltransferase [Microbacterium sp. EST19A]|uniref:ThiF family adenylyltransferase n=1 Tax=Microbacterium sp. EST19A TaxID=2862681 RepID=UPI001CBF2141|nr:ThiF family adenylyltransferase [Microbacterium sp. EST19A]
MHNSMVRIGAQQGITRELEDPKGELRVLLPLLDGTRSLESVIARAGELMPRLRAEQIREGLALLDESGLIEDASLYDELPERLHANQAFFTAAAATSDSKGNRAQGVLQESHVLLLGLGGGGSACLPQLLALGLGRLTIVDYDVVETSNLNRQTLFRTSDLGRKKLDVAREYAKAFAPSTEVSAYDLRIEGVEQVQHLAEGTAGILCTIDEPPFVAQRRVNAAAIALKLPATFLLSQHTRGRVFSVKTEESGCMDCLQIHDELNTVDFLPQYRALMSPERPGTTAAIAPHIQRLASYGVDEILRLTTRYAAPIALGKQVEIDYLTGELGTLMAWDRHEGCPTCGTADPRFEYVFEVAPL